MAHFCGRKQKAVSWKETESEKYGRRKGHMSIRISLAGTWYQRKDTVKIKLATEKVYLLQKKKKPFFLAEIFVNVLPSH